jgi:hypothetical protein
MGDKGMVVEITGLAHFLVDPLQVIVHRFHGVENGLGLLWRDEFHDGALQASSLVAM